MEFLIGLDIGVTAVKGSLVSSAGDVISTEVGHIGSMAGPPGFLEIDPQEYYGTVCAVIKRLTASAPEKDAVRGLSVAAASGNSILLDRHKRPLTNIIHCLDRRCLGVSGELLPGFDFSSIYPVVGWPWIEMFPFAHLMWLRANRERLYQEAEFVGMAVNYLYLRLTERWQTDPSTATPFYLQDQADGKWHIPFLDALDISASRLPGILPSGTGVGKATPAARADTGLSDKTEIVLGSFDHPSAARGTGVLRPGDLLFSCGTSWVGFYPLESREKALSCDLLVDPFLSPDGPWAGMSSVLAVGRKIDWFIDNLVAPAAEDGTDKYGFFSRAAEKADPGAGGLVLNMMDPEDARQHVGRIRSGFPVADIARAIMESAVFEAMHRIIELEDKGLVAGNIFMVGGPTESTVWVRVLADALGRDINLVNGRGAGAFGAAVLAGIGTGVYRDVYQAEAVLEKKKRVVRPEPGLHGRFREMLEHHRRLKDEERIA